MQTRGKQSVLFGMRQIESERPPPLPELGEAEAAEWRRIVDRMPADWFTAETWPVLAALCRHTVSSHAVGRGMAALSAGSLDTPERITTYRQLHEMLLADTSMIARLSTRLRLTLQSRVQKDKAGGKVDNAPVSRPWSKGKARA